MAEYRNYTISPFIQFSHQILLLDDNLSLSDFSERIRKITSCNISHHAPISILYNFQLNTRIFITYCTAPLLLSDDGMRKTRIMLFPLSNLMSLYWIDVHTVMAILNGHFFCAIVTGIRIIVHCGALCVMRRGEASSFCWRFQILSFNKDGTLGSLLKQTLVSPLH